MPRLSGHRASGTDLLRLGSHPSRRRAVIFAALTAIIGIIVVWTIFAAGTPVAFEAEGGTLTSPASLVAATGASGGSAVEFSSVATPTPTPTSACPAYPAYPDASCTGYAHTGVTLAKVPAQATSGAGWAWNSSSGEVVTTTANTTISGLDISGGFEDDKGGATFTKSWVRCSGIDADNACASFAPGAKVSDVEFGGCANGTSYCGAGIYTGGSNSGNTFTRINIHGTADGMRTDGGTTVTDSYIHQIYFGNDPKGNLVHGDGSQTTQGSNITFQHDTIEGGDDCGLFFSADDGAISNILVNQSHLIGVTMSGENTSSSVGFSADVTGATITNNLFSGAGAGGSIGSVRNGGSGRLSFNSTSWNNNKLDNGTVSPAP